jgi:Rrf2 family nitric oxide-sensitive transcriptional repressor
VRGTEEDFALVECFQDGNRNCPIIPACALPPVLERALDAFFRQLDSQSLADLVRPREKLASLFSRTVLSRQPQ